MDTAYCLILLVTFMPSLVLCLDWDEAVRTVNTSVQDENVVARRNLGYRHEVTRARVGPGRGRKALSTSDCDNVVQIPFGILVELNLDPDFYEKYTHAYGIPIVSSGSPVDEALTRACYVVRFMLADRKDIRNLMYDFYAQVSVIGQRELTNDIPEYRHYDNAWNTRARGLGGTQSIPVSSDAEENLLCIRNTTIDRWYEEDVLVHEFGHAIHLIALNYLEYYTFGPKLQRTFNRAKSSGLWLSTYAATRTSEYFAEGVQAYFSVNTDRNFTDGIHNNVSTRETLFEYDRPLYYIIEQVFPCRNVIVDRCEADQDAAISNMPMLMDCPWTE